MAREIVCCNGCGRDVDITERKKKNPPIFCTRCIGSHMGKPKTHLPSEELGRKQLPPIASGLPKHDNYNAESVP
jgi:hypothetical protein